MLWYMPKGPPEVMLKPSTADGVYDHFIKSEKNICRFGARFATDGKYFWKQSSALGLLALWLLLLQFLLSLVALALHLRRVLLSL